jgi:hypothetical protein
MFILLLVASGAVSAQAETVFMPGKPGAIVTADQAADAKDGAFQCQRVRRGPNINPVKVPGSETLWSTNPGKGVDDVAGLFKGGKEAYRCKRMRLDVASGRMKTFN